jgi:sugar phosphate isomerase/epimerase
MKGPGLFLAQFLAERPPFDRLETFAAWAGEAGHVGIQLPTSAENLFDLHLAAESVTYCDTLRGMLAERGVVISELSTHRQGQLIGVHSIYEPAFRSYAPETLRDRPDAWPGWAAEQLVLAARASRNLGLDTHVSFSGALAWPYLHPWPAPMQELAAGALAELARRWRPVLDRFDEVGVDVCFEIHPTTDLHDGASFERFVELVGGHPRARILYDPSHMVLQQMDYLGFIAVYHDRIGAFHVKDAIYLADGRSGTAGGFQGWSDRPGRYMDAGLGQIDLDAIFAALAHHGYEGWAIYERADGKIDPTISARAGASFIRERLPTR